MSIRLAVYAAIAVCSLVSLLTLSIVNSTYSREIDKSPSDTYSVISILFPIPFFFIYLYKYSDRSKGNYQTTRPVKLILSTFTGGLIIAPAVVAIVTTDPIVTVRRLAIAMPVSIFLTYFILFNLLELQFYNAKVLFGLINE